MKNELQIVKEYKPAKADTKEDVYTLSKKALELKRLEKQTLSVDASAKLTLMILAITLFILYNSITKGVFKSEDPLLIFMSTLLPLIGLLAISNMIRFELQTMYRIEVFKENNPYLYSRSELNLLNIINLKLKEDTQIEHLAVGELKLTLNSEKQNYQIIDLKTSQALFETLEKRDDYYLVQDLKNKTELLISSESAKKLKEAINDKPSSITKIKAFSHRQLLPDDLLEERFLDDITLSTQDGQKVIS